MSHRSITQRKSTAARPGSSGIPEGLIAKSSLFALLEQAPAPICIFKGPEHRFEFVNPLYARLFSNRDLAGKPIREALPELEGQGYSEILDGVYQTGQPFAGRESPARIDRHGDGRLEEAFFNFIYQPLHTPDGRIDGIMVFAYEVTDLVESRREAEALAASLQAANREKEDFIAAISHELRTPLTSILGWTRMVQLGGLDAETYRSALDSIERSTKAQAQLIEDLLDESRIAAGKLRLELQTLRINDVIGGAIDTVAPLAREHEVRLETNLPSQPIMVRGDPIRMQQVVTNLLSNAIKFTTAGGAVTLSLTQRDVNAVLTVADTGRGIRAEFLPHVFDRFRQDDSASSERRGGLGLGLSIVRHLVELHGGSVWAASDGDGKGSAFTVQLPLVTTLEDVTSLKEREDGLRYSSLPSLAGVKVLIVEDEIDNRTVLAAVLRRCGADVDLATTAGQGLEKVRNWRPDVILSDVMLPDRDGCSLMRDVRALADDRGGRTPAMALSVHARPDERDRAIDAGFAIFRQKPIEPADLAFDIARLARLR